MKTFTSLSLFMTLFIVAKCDITSEPTTTPQPSGGSTPTGGVTVSKSPEEIRHKIKEQVLALTESCKTSTKITGEQAKIVSNQAIPKTEAEKCFLECMYNGLNITKDGKFIEISAKGLAQHRFANSPDELTKANNMIETCTKEAIVKDANEKCAIGRLVRECFVKHGSKINFFPKP
ncbi:uncharacterized protein [Halyomorpha halys]|uniref:uncharacterized protein n=1 Tax=Halyomorpha halys TaxID=286706 RepID=UPI0006D51F0C|nr:uncharacterized protein LOC106688070 [Halyomorpha halys]KAE8573295.1 Odorant-binding protein 2 [Halyomorpha halys]